MVWGGGQVRHCLSARRVSAIAQLSAGCVPVPSLVPLSPVGVGLAWSRPCWFPLCAAASPALLSGLRWCFFNQLLDHHEVLW